MFQCKNCGNCCKFGSGFLAEDDKQKIAKHLNISEQELENKYLEKTNMFGTEALRPKFQKPFGLCIFFNKETHCTIHEVKPLLCRLADCQTDKTEEFYRKYFVKNTELSRIEWEARRIK